MLDLMAASHSRSVALLELSISSFINEKTEWVPQLEVALYTVPPATATHRA